MSPYQQDVIDATLQEYDLQAQKGLGNYLKVLLLLVLLVVQEKVLHKQNICQTQIETEQHYKHNY